MEKTASNTKRNVLSKISQVFDPLGLVAPVLIVGKIIMQQIWKQDVEWDQELPANLKIAWKDYYASLTRLNDLSIQRNVNINNKSTTFDIYGFGDASETAYGACVYAVSTNEQGISHSELICARAKVAPLKTISLPRLELEAALLLSQLYNIVKGACADRINKVFLWSDSTVTLGWIKTPPHTLKTFVANRISKIQDLTEEAIWLHVASEDNPADLLSRGVTVQRLIQDRLWWNGPCWLREGKQYPPLMENLEINLPELRASSVTLVSTLTRQILRKYSSYSKLCRVIAFCYRFAENCRSNRKTTLFSPAEMERAEKVVIRWVQQESFPMEIHCLQENRLLPRKSSLCALAAYLDNEGLIRVGDRLRHAEIQSDQKNPIVLPTRHHVTSIILRDRHERLLHCPPKQLLYDNDSGPSVEDEKSAKLLKGASSAIDLIQLQRRSRWEIYPLREFAVTIDPLR